MATVHCTLHGFWFWTNLSSGNFVYFCKSDVSAVQGHPRSLILVPIESAYATDRQTDRRLTVASPRSALASRGKNRRVRETNRHGTFIQLLRVLQRTLGHSQKWTFACSAVRVEFISDLALAAITTDSVDADVLTAVVIRLTFVVFCTNNNYTRCSIMLRIHYTRFPVTSP